jgi:hypothetical protein
MDRRRRTFGQGKDSWPVWLIVVAGAKRLAGVVEGEQQQLTINEKLFIVYLLSPFLTINEKLLIV